MRSRTSECRRTGSTPTRKNRSVASGRVVAKRWRPMMPRCGRGIKPNEQWLWRTTCRLRRDGHTVWHISPRSWSSTGRWSPIDFRTQPAPLPPVKWSGSISSFLTLESGDWSNIPPRPDMTMTIGDRRTSFRNGKSSSWLPVAIFHHSAPSLQSVFQSTLC